MLKHYVLFKFAEGTDLQDILKKFQATYKELKSTGVVNDYELYLSDPMLEGNMQLMLIDHLDDFDAFERYMKDEVHVALITSLKGIVTEVRRFDLYC